MACTVTVTDTPDCVCGFMSVERVYALFEYIRVRRRRIRSFRSQLVIFPHIMFTCGGQVTKWIMGGRLRSTGKEFPELQIWRPSGNNTYQIVNSTIIFELSHEDDNVYEYTVDPPLSFQSGDTLGLFQPESFESLLQLDYDRYRGSVYYFPYLSRSVDANNSYFDINSEDVFSRTGIPLVSASIGKFYSNVCFLGQCMQQYYVIYCSMYLFKP